MNDLLDGMAVGPVTETAPIPSYILLEDGVSKILLEDSSGDILMET